MNLAFICLIAFVMVFTVLSVLAAAMAGITRLFPPTPAVSRTTVEPELLAAIQATVASAFNGARVVHIEEK